MENDLKITRRHLPHWTLEGATYFVTFRTHRTSLSESEQAIVLSHIKEGGESFYNCCAAVVMPDHVHILIRPKEGIELSRIMKGIKGVSARRINQRRRATGQVWQKESFDRIVRDEKELKEKLNYMLHNPVEKGLTADPWKYVGWHYNEKFGGSA